MCSPTESAAPVDVLIAEDDAPTRRALRSLLEREGLTCAEAGDGCEAVALAQRHPPRSVLLDLGMPGLDGFAVAHRLQADPRTRSAHLHCLTARNDPQTCHRALAAGFDTFLSKPVDVEALLRVIRGQPPAARQGVVGDLTLAQAEQLLDWLENHGCTQLQASWVGGKVSVRCVCPPGLRLVREAGGRVRLVRV